MAETMSNDINQQYQLGYDNTVQRMFNHLDRMAVEATARADRREHPINAEQSDPGAVAHYRGAACAAHHIDQAIRVAGDELGEAIDRLRSADSG